MHGCATLSAAEGWRRGRSGGRARAFARESLLERALAARGARAARSCARAPSSSRPTTVSALVGLAAASRRASSRSGSPRSTRHCPVSRRSSSRALAPPFVCRVPARLAQELARAGARPIRVERQMVRLDPCAVAAPLDPRDRATLRRGRARALLRPRLRAARARARRRSSASATRSASSPPSRGARFLTERVALLGAPRDARGLPPPGLRARARPRARARARDAGAPRRDPRATTGAGPPSTCSPSSASAARTTSPFSLAKAKRRVVDGEGACTRGAGARSSPRSRRTWGSRSRSSSRSRSPAPRRCSPRRCTRSRTRATRRCSSWAARARGARPTDEHPFGYGRERYFWAFVVALVLFSLGALFAVGEGIEKLLHPHELESPYVAIAVLGVSIALETASFVTARREANLCGRVSRGSRSSATPRTPSCRSCCSRTWRADRASRSRALGIGLAIWHRRPALRRRGLDRDRRAARRGSRSCSRSR